MPSPLEQALSRLDPGAKGGDDTLGDYFKTLQEYAGPPLKKLLTDPNINAQHPLNAVGPAMDLLASPFSAAGNTYVGRDPYATGRDRRIGGHLGGMVMPLPGAGEEQAARELEMEAEALGGEVRPMLRAPHSVNPTATVNHPNIKPHLEHVPISWIDRLHHEYLPDDFEDRVQQEMHHLSLEGVNDPMLIRAGSESRNAVIDNPTMVAQMEAAKRLGYTHYPTLVHLSPTAGLYDKGTVHIGQDIAEHGSLPYQYHPPSKVFKSLQPSPHGSPKAAIAARKAARGATPALHGTRVDFPGGKFPVANTAERGDKGFDMRFGIHTGANTSTAGHFARRSGGKMWSVGLPPEEQTYEMEQVTNPDNLRTYLPFSSPWIEKGLENDTRAMNRAISEWALMGNREGIERYLTTELGVYPPEKVPELAEKLAKGWRVPIRKGSQPMTLWQHLGDYSIAHSGTREQSMDAINRAIKNLERYGYLNTKYQNTIEYSEGRDPTSYITPDPKNIRPWERIHAETGQPIPNPAQMGDYPEISMSDYTKSLLSPKGPRAGIGPGKEDDVRAVLQMMLDKIQAQGAQTPGIADDLRNIGPFMPEPQPDLQQGWTFQQLLDRLTPK